MSALTLDSLYALRKAGEYSAPAKASDVLPVLFGDLTENSGDAAITPCVCLNTTTHVYAISGRAILSALNGNTFRFWDEDGDEITSSHYTVQTAVDYEDLGTIATVTCDADYGEISAQCKGAIDANGTLITNPIEIFTEIVGDTASFDRTSLLKATVQANDLGYVAAGAITSEHQYKTWLNNLASSFLIDWILGPDGTIRLRVDSSTITGLQPAFFLRERETTRVEAFQYADHIRNQVGVYYAPSYATRDRRFREGVNANYLQYDDGESTKDVNSIRRYGLRDYPSLELDWCRNTASVQILQARLIERFANPFWLIQWDELSKQAMYANVGDFGVYAWRHRIDADGNPMTNRYVQVLEKAIPLVGGGIQLYLRETTMPYSTVINYWDGTDQTLGDGQKWGGG